MGGEIHLYNTVTQGRVSSVYRPIALRVCRAYRMVSGEAVCIFAGIILLVLVGKNPHTAAT